MAYTLWLRDNKTLLLLRTTAIILVMLLMLPAKLEAQEKIKNEGILQGRVVDQISGEPLELVYVSIVNHPNLAVITDKLGYYIFEKLPTEYLRVKFEHVSHHPYISDPVLITTARPYQMDVSLEEVALDVGVISVKGRSNRRIELPPLSVHRINVQQIEKSPGVNRDISKAVQNLPGVLATPIYRNDLIVRGGGPNENKFYLDKIEIPVLNHFQTQGSSGGNSGMINTDFLNGATLYTSAFPVSKPGALSSVLDMKLKEGNSLKPKFKLALGASDLAFTLDTPISKKSNLLFSYRRSYLQFLFSLIDLPFLPTYNDSQIKYTYNFDDRNKLYILGLGSLDKNRLNKSLRDLSPSRQQIIDYLPESDQWSYVFGAVYRHITPNGSSLNFILSTNKLYNSLQKWQDNDPELGKNLDYKSSEMEGKFRVEYATDLGSGISLSAGADVRQTFYDNTTYRKLFFEEQPVDNIYQSQINNTAYGAYIGLDKSFVGNKVHVTLSGRVDGNNYNRHQSNPLKQFSPRLAASYNINKKFSINGNLGRYYQSPSYTTMGYRLSNGTLDNKDRLRYFYSDQAAVGFAFASNELSKLTVEGFFKSYSRYPFSRVDSTAIGSNGTDVFAVGAEPVSSSGKGHAYGFEVHYTNDDLWGFKFDISYTYYISQFRKMDQNFMPTGPYCSSNWDNRHLLNIILGRSFKKGWDIGARWRLAAGAPYTPYDIQASGAIDSWNQTHKPEINYSLYNTERLPTFHQLDLRIDKTWFLKKATLGLYVDIQNLYNYKALGQEILMPQTDQNGQYIKDPTRPGYYKMESYPNTLGGTIIPTLGIIIEI